jgi:hypothetical protein
MDFLKLEKKFKVVLMRWHEGIIVRPSEPISEAEEKSLSRAYFLIMNKRGKLCIHLNGLLDLSEMDIETRTHKFYPVKSTRLKACRNIESCLSWINRFRCLDDESQDAVLARHDIQSRDNNLVAIFCDYIRLERFDPKANKWLTIDSSIDETRIQSLHDTLSKNSITQYRTRRTTRRHFVTDKTTLKQLADSKQIYNVNMSASPVLNSNMGISDYNKTPKRNRTARFWNGR